MKTHDTLEHDVEIRIHDALIASAQDDVEHISVGVEGSRAILRGQVRSWTEHEDVERAALSAPGITSVDNQIALVIKATLRAHPA